jgi:hypothetical protein
LWCGALLGPGEALHGHDNGGRKFRRQSRKFCCDKAAIVVAFVEVNTFLGKSMDPVTLLGVISSIIAIVDVIRRQDGEVTPVSVRLLYDEQARSPDTLENRMDARPSEIAAAIDIVLAINSISASFLDRIKRTCLQDFDDAIRDHHGKDAVEVREAYHDAQRCVCINIDTARRSNGGNIPPELMELYRRFGCATM